MLRTTTNVAVLFLLLLGAPATSRADWSTDPLVNNPVSTGLLTQQQPSLAPDGHGGVFVAYIDYRTEKNVYAQHIDAAGNRLWGNDGVAVTTAWGEDMLDYWGTSVVADAVGGAFVVFMTRVYIVGTTTARVQHLDANGVPQWPDTGTVLSRDPNTLLPIAIADGQGGFFASWGGTGSSLYVQHYSPAGFSQWVSTQGAKVCQSLAPQNQRMISDGNGGLLLAWEDYRGPAGDIYAQHVDSNGAMKWLANGVPLCTAAADQYLQGLCDDGAGGAIAVWADYRSGYARMYARRVSGSGVALWATDGVEACTYPGGQYYPAMDMTGDGAGGAILTWGDHRAPALDLYAQRMDGSGSRLWGETGTPLCTADGVQYRQRVIPDGANGAFVVWADSRSGSYELYAQRIGPDGSRLWAPEGIRISSASGNQDQIAMVESGDGVIAAFTDLRHPTTDVYAQQFSRDGILGAIVTGVGPGSGSGGGLQLSIAPLPAAREVTFSFAPAAAGPVSLALFDPQGRLLRRIDARADGAGTQHLRWDLRGGDGRRVPGGVYLARLELKGEVRTARFVVMD